MKKLTGQVIGVKTAETAVVSIERFWQHPLYQKRIKRSKKYLVDDQIGVKAGDRVMIQECRPISKRKRWQVIKKL